MRGIWLLIVGVVLMGCGKTQPQRPNFHGETEPDSMTVQLLTMNQQMAEQADKQLTRVATSEFVLMDENYWVKGLYPQDDNLPTLDENEYVQFEAELFTLEGRLLGAHQASVKLGQVDEMQAVVQVLPLMQHNMQVTLLVPWYMAYGSAGSAEVPPYENLRVELSVR